MVNKVLIVKLLTVRCMWSINKLINKLSFDFTSYVDVTSLFSMVVATILKY